MTISAWIGWAMISIFIAILVISKGYTYSWKENYKPLVIGIMTAMIISFIILCAMLWYYGSTASGARALKTQESNFNHGIMRRITVYDVRGDVLQTYEGKFDLEYDDDRILFDDDKGLRHVIYYPTGTVIIDEIKEENE